MIMHIAEVAPVLVSVGRKDGLLSLSFPILLVKIIITSKDQYY